MHSSRLPHLGSGKSSYDALEYVVYLVGQGNESDYERDTDESADQSILNHDNAFLILNELHQFSHLSILLWLMIRENRTYCPFADAQFVLMLHPLSFFVDTDRLRSLLFHVIEILFIAAELMRYSYMS